MTTVNPYEVLGVTPDAEQEAIYGAFRGLARKYHPDANRGDWAGAERMKLINEAYHILGHAGRRAAYDYEYGLATNSGRRPGAGETHVASPAQRNSYPHRPARSDTSGPERREPPLTSRRSMERLLIWIGTALTTFVITGSIAAATSNAWPLTAWFLGSFLVGTVVLLVDGGRPTPRKRFVNVLGCAWLVVTSFCVAGLIENSDPSANGAPLTAWLALWALIAGLALIARAGQPNQRVTRPPSTAYATYRRRSGSHQSAARRRSGGGR